MGGCYLMKMKKLGKDFSKVLMIMFLFAVLLGNKVQALPVFSDTSNQMSLKPSTIIWDSENDPYAVKLQWDFLEINSGVTVISITGVSPIPFSYASLYWTIGDNDIFIQPEQFKAGYRSRVSGKEWDDWFVSSEIEYLSDIDRYIAPFYMVTDSKVRQEFEVIIALPLGVNLKNVILELANHISDTNIHDFSEDVEYNSR